MDTPSYAKTMEEWLRCIGQEVMDETNACSQSQKDANEVAIRNIMLRLQREHPQLFINHPNGLAPRH